MIAPDYLYNEAKECRCCGSTDLYPYLNLLNQPLANSYHKRRQSEGIKDAEIEEYPLVVNLCKSCFHSQLSIVVDPDTMFSHYLYVSGTTETFRKHCQELAQNAVCRWTKDLIKDVSQWVADSEFNSKDDCRWKTGEKNTPKVLDVACNDGTLLEQFRKLGCDVHGVDPSVNLRVLTLDKDIPVEVDFWGKRVAEYIGKVDIITATNVFAHVDDVEDFLNTCKIALNPDGFAVIEFPYCKDMIAKNEFDTVYHEHLSYFLVNSFSTLSRRCGFQIMDVILTPIHGTSIRFIIRPSDEPDCDLVKELIQKEKDNGMLNVQTYEDFAQRVYINKVVFSDEVRKYRHTHGIVGFGASAKGNTMLNFFNLHLDYVVDNNDLKWDHLTPGMNVAIVSPEHMKNDPRPLAIVIMSWNFAKEIIKKIEALRPGKKDIVLLYVPETRALELPLTDESAVSSISG